MSEYSVFEVTSSDQGNPSAGTAFAIDRVASRTYLVTCAHVIRAVGQASVRIDEDSDVRVEALGDPDGPDDLAVLSAELPSARPLRLSPSSPAGGECTVVGYTSVVGGAAVARHGDRLAELTQLRSIPGRLADRTQLRRPGRSAVPAWMLSTSEDLTEGISGGPVIDGDSREVVGVASLSFCGQGKAIAIAAEALQKLWPAGVDRLRGARPVRGIGFVPVPGGTFQMGTSESRAAELAELKTAGNFLSEAPACQVSIPGYYISRHVVTNSQYAEFTRATGHRVPQAGDSMSQQVQLASAYPAPSGGHGRLSRGAGLLARRRRLLRVVRRAAAHRGRMGEGGPGHPRMGVALGRPVGPRPLQHGRRPAAAGHDAGGHVLPARR